jgi:GT2 family glycosyltransferase
VIDPRSQSQGEPFVGVVTVLYQSDEVLPDFMRSLSALRGQGRIKLYVVDNSPKISGTDLAKTLAAQSSIDAICVFNGSNVGVAAGNNQGIRMALADGCTHVLLANNDTAFGPDAVAELLSRMRDNGARAATPKIHYHGSNLIWYGGGDFNPWTVRCPHLGMLEQDRGQRDRIGYTAYAPTCFMLVESKVFVQIGIMDERYFCYYDDTDFAWRLAQAHIGLLYAPSSVVEHKVSTSTGGDLSPFSLYYMNRNRVYFARKNLRGLRKWFALLYMSATRLPGSARLPRALASRMWAGFRDGWKVPVA